MMASFRIIFVLVFLALSKESWAATNHVYMYPTWCGTTLEVTAAKVIWPATNYRAEANLYGASYDCTVVARAEYLNQTINLYANLALSQPTVPAGTTSPVSVAMTTMTSENITVTTQATNSTANVTSGNVATSTSSTVTSGNLSTSSTVTNPVASVTSGNDITTSCDTDYIAIYDGPDTSANLIEKLCYGNTLLDTGNQDSSGPYVTFRFVRSGKYLYNFTMWYTSFHTGSCEDRSTWLECASGRCIKFHLICDSANNCGRGDDTDQSNNAPASCEEEEPVAISPDYTPIWVSLGLLGGLLASFVVYWCCWRPGWGPWRFAVLRQLGCCPKKAGSGGKTDAMSLNSGRDGSVDGKMSAYGDDEESGEGAEGPEPASGGLFSCFRGSKPGGPWNTGKVGHAGQVGGRDKGSPKTGRWGQQRERPPGGDGDSDVGDDYYRMDDVFYADVYDIDDYAGGHAREAR
ncbi:uncharacterized protein [Branchiostoma lanceolatum]|uniref:uncharacterized protein isoform X1 n=2 Tax=Branchiostoma lanceolatum TaxID=7740 RepID=UPI003451ECA9